METLHQYEDLMSSGAFRCKSCKNNLNPTVWLHDGGNMCQRCCNVNLRPISIQNDAISTVMSHSLLPCRFQSQGCAQLLFDDELETHQSICLYQSSETCFIDDCQWTGKRGDIAKHFRMSHKNILESEDGRTFSFDCQQIEDVSYALLETFNGSFFVRMKKSAKKLQIMICDAESYSRQLGEFHLRYVAQSNKILKVRCSIIRHINISAFREADEDYVLNVNLNKFFSRGSDAKPMVVDLIYHLKDYLPLPKALSQKLSCVVCGELARDSLVCPREHMVCHHCNEEQLHEDCGEVTANQTLMLISKLYFLPCPYKKFGCKFNIQTPSVHEFRCRYRAIKCPDEACPFTGILQDLKRHVKSDHSKDYVDEDFCIFEHNGENFDQYFLAYNKLFHFRFARETYTEGTDEGKYYYSWKVTGLGTKDDYASFMFVIGSMSPETDKKFIACEPLITEHSLANGFMLPEEQKQKYFPNKFYFYVKITYSGNYQEFKNHTELNSVRRRQRY